MLRACLRLRTLLPSAHARGSLAFSNSRARRAPGVWMACDGGLRAAASGTGNGPVHAAIVKKLTEGLEPVSLVVTDNSADHAGHAGNPTGSPSAESHFEVDVVSAKFAGVKPVGRHRLVYELIDAEMKGTSVPGHPGVHALSIKARAP